MSRIFLIFNTFASFEYATVKVENKNVWMIVMKIYDYNGKKNICGERIHEARCRLRLTQSELAARLQVRGINIERDSISRIEIGTRFVADYELRELSRALKASPLWLLGIDEKP